MPSPHWALIAEHLNDCLAKSRLSSQDLARKAGVDRKTVDRLRAGHSVRTQTLQWIEQALGVQLGQRSDSRTATSDPEYGGYQRSVVEPYVGEYTGYRRPFDKPRQLIASYLAIHWDSGVNALRFTETQHNQADGGREYAYEFAGDVLIPPNLGVMHLVVRSGDGRIRLISTSMPREERGTVTMKGFMLTLNELSDIGFYPVTTPIYFVRSSANRPLRTGVITADDENYPHTAAILDGIEEKFLPPTV